MFNKKQAHSDPVKEVVSEYLRAADKLVRQKRYDEALLEIENAYKIDPKNMYTRSFLERTRYMIEKENEKRSQVFGGEINMTSENRMETISQLFKAAEEFIKEKKYHHALNAVGKVFHIDPKNYYAEAFSERIELLIQAEASNKEINKTQTPPPIVSEPEVPPLEKPVSVAPHKEPVQYTNIPTPAPMLSNEPQEEIGRYALYKELLKECWADGVITPEESDMLHRVRSQYSISFDMHCQIEVDIKIDAYVDALRIVWRDGVVNDNEQEVLEIMRKKYGITPEEQAAAEKKFSLLRKTKKLKALILIVDIDQDNSIYVARAIISHGYDVKIETHPDDALRFLETHTPDIILSEAVFPQLETDGFEFFQKTRAIERLCQIPFLMMTPSGDARIVRAGLRMGVDYFIPKPLNIGFMMAIIEGKLKSGLQTIVQK